MTKLTIEFPEDIYTALRRSPHEVARDVRLAAAIAWYQQGILSQGRATEIAGVSRSEFIDALAARKIDVIHVDLDEIDREARGG